ncbi:MAG: DUF3078 domain-containing protein [Bacteroidota bacterium]
MKRLSLLTIFSLILIGNYTFGQTTEELQEMKDAKVAELGSLETQLAELTAKVEGLQGEVAGLTDQLTPYPRWDNGILGNLGFSIANFDSWLLRDQANVSTSAANISITSTAFANGEWEKSFWRNSANLTLGWLKFDNKSVPDSEENQDFQVAADAFNIISLYGYKLSDKIAVSTLGEYRTSILDGRFNNPGYLDLGLGVTWTPITDLVVVVHPLNYNFIFADEGSEFQSSLGAKIVADYTAQLTEGVAWKSNLSAFMSYEGSELSNWNWVNSFSTAYKGIGIGLDIGLRQNQQEVNAFNANADVAADRKLDGNPLQTYWILGLSYAISSK